MPQSSVLSFLCLVPLAFVQCINAGEAPVILIPGMYGSKVFAKMTSDEGRGLGCRGFYQGMYDELHTRFQIWHGAYTFAGLTCFNYNWQVRFDEEDGYRNQSGMELWVEDFGGLSSIDTIGGTQDVYNDIIKDLQQHEFEEHVNLHGVPYDFRMAGRVYEEPGNLYSQLRMLIESAVRKAGRPARIISHSQGCALFQDFLVRYIPSFAPDGWKNEFIENFIALAPTWGGSALLWQNYASGVAILPVLPTNTLRSSMITTPVNAWLSPVKEVWGDRGILTAGAKTYTAADFDTLLADIGIEGAIKMSKDMQKHDATLGNILVHPGVETHVLYGVAVETPVRFKYAREFGGKGDAARAPHVSSDSGDGTVPAFAAKAFQLWGTVEGKKVQSYEIPGVEHNNFLHDAHVRNQILQILGVSKSEECVASGEDVCKVAKGSKFM